MRWTPVSNLRVWNSKETSYPLVGWRDIASLIEVTLINLVHPCPVPRSRLAYDSATFPRNTSP